MRVVVATGRTEETLSTDGVILTNGFTGRQGQDIARAFLKRGAEVTVVSGPTDLPDVAGARTVHVRTMRAMQEAVRAAVAIRADVYVSAAAIADFSLDAPVDLRLRPGVPHVLALRENPSLLKDIAFHANRPKIVVGFAAQAAETLLAYALEKFETTGADLTVANPIGAGRDPARNTIHFIFRADGDIRVEDAGEMSKAEAAERIVDKILSLQP